jgi:DNA invertase Pin-like site-specific DNA recombinase
MAMGMIATVSGKFVAYYRVSTAKQGKSGLGLEAQQASVSTFLKEGNWKLVGEVEEVESGTRKGNHRPGLQEALTLCRLHNASLLIAKLDRLARNVAFISNLKESGVKFIAVDQPQANDMTVYILAAVAQNEAEAISQRTKAALAAAKAKGVVLGGDRGNIAGESAKGNKASAAVRQAQARKRANDLKPVIHAIQADGATSLRQIAAALNERGIPTARGGRWSAVQVQIVLKQLAE